MASFTQIIERRHRRKARLQAAQGRSRLWFGLIAAGVGLLIILPLGVMIGGAAFLYTQAVRDLPSPQETIASGPVIGPTQLYDRSGQTLLFAVEDPLGDQRTWIRLDSLPPFVGQATMLLEDPDFLTRQPPGALDTFVKLWRNLLEGPLPSDVTITGRLVRDAIAPEPEVVSADLRSREIALVAEISRRYTPQQILEWHLNTNYYGNEAYGIEAAAQAYLGKHAADLTLDEAALLAAIPNAPQYNPIDDETAARGRQADALRLMLAQGAITQEQYTQASNRSTPIVPNTKQVAQIAPEFTLYARRQAEDILNSMGREGARLVTRGGLKITTTLDVDLYWQSECALRTYLARLGGQLPDGRTLNGSTCSSAAYLPAVNIATTAPPDHGALVIVDVNTGEIKSMAGAANKSDSQPGPTLFPFVYFEGFRGGLNPASMVLDIPRPFPGAAEGLIYTPNNADGNFQGVLNLRDAMGAGLLPPAVDVAQSRGMVNILSSAHQIGINGLSDGLYDLSLLERGGSVSLLDIAYSYSVFASLGSMRGVHVNPAGPNYRERDPLAVLKIEDAEGNTLWQYDLKQTGDHCTTVNCTTKFVPELGYLVNDILADAKTRWGVLGEGNVLDLSRPAAVVNGLTGDKLDDWTVGYTPQYVVGVHVGRDDKQPMQLDPYGLQGGAAVWRAVMEYTHARDNLPLATWQRPDTIVTQTVCQWSGLLPNGNCPVEQEIFIDGFQPRQTDTFWQTVDINSDSKQLATINTPAGLVVKQQFFVPPPDALDWWKTHHKPLPPTEYDSVSVPNVLSATQILQPQALAYVGGKVDVRGSMDAGTLQYYQLAYGQGVNPAEWTTIGGQQTSYSPGVSLGTWDTSGLDGLYTLRLSVILKDNKIETAFAQVTVDNVPPTIQLTAGDPGKVFQFPDDATIPLVADVQDNLGIDRVEFYHNGQFVGADKDFPFGFNWQITRTGTEVFSATVFDKVGNSASADLTVQVGRSG